jgi:hypothetical protein
MAPCGNNTNQRLYILTFEPEWVTYATLALGRGQLMLQDGDTPCKIINGCSYIKENTSWVLARVMRDFKHWRDCGIDKYVDEVL